MTIVEKRPSNPAAERARDEFLRTGDAARTLAERTATVDGLVLATAEEVLFPAVPQGLAVLAVGGYGRRHLFPYSDVDLLLLFESERLAHGAREAISGFLQKLWDLRLRVSHSVRTPGECAELHEQNIELNISLLDQRYLAGDRGLYARMGELLPRFLQAQRDALARHLARLTRERHQKYHDTIYHLEPNVKETPGGLRDYQLICWLGQLRGAPADAACELRQAWSFFSRLRCLLHYHAERDSNALTFDEQERAAEHWANQDTAGWMRDYFRHARAVHGAAQRALEASQAQSSSLFSQFRDWRTRLSNADFSVSRERVHFRAHQQLEADPDLVLRLFSFVARHGVRLSLEAEQRIAARRERLAEHFAAPRAIWGVLDELFSLPYAPLALRAMHETGVLAMLFPELEQIECLVIRDFYHRYTVDEHTLVTIQNLAELRRTTEGWRKRYTDLLAELGSLGPLVFALLFHDVGKAHPDHGHVEASREIAEPAMERLEMPLADRETVHFLIRSHLEMSAAMHARDLHDPATAEYMAHRIGTVERLKALTLMTYADISAVNPTALTPWRAEQLWQLYLLSYNELTRELESERIEAAASTAVPEFLEGIPTRYLRTHSAAEIEAHARLEEAHRRRGVAVQLERQDAAWRLTLVTSDRPFLFASVAGTLSSFGLNILKAEAFSNRRGLVLDSFTFADPHRSLELNASEIDRLRAMLERVVLGKSDVKQLLLNRPKAPLPSRKSRIVPSVAFDSQASRSATLIQIVAEDRPGLLYDLASAMSSHGCNIEVVLIDTEAHKAIDVFYVTAGGEKLAPEQQERLGLALRRVCQAA